MFFLGHSVDAKLPKSLIDWLLTVYRYKVVRVFPKTTQQIDVVRGLEDDLHPAVGSSVFIQWP